MLFRAIGLASVLVAGVYLAHPWVGEAMEPDAATPLAAEAPAVELPPVLTRRVIAHIPWFSFSDYCNTADRIVLGTVEDERTEVSQAGDPFLEYGLSIEESWKNSQQGGRIRVRVAGGEADGVRVIVDRAPAFRVGERVLLFLVGTDEGWYGVLGLDQGVYRLDTSWDAEIVGLHAGAGETLGHVRERILSVLGQTSGGNR